MNDDNMQPAERDGEPPLSWIYRTMDVVFYAQVCIIVVVLVYFIASWV